LHDVKHCVTIISEAQLQTKEIFYQMKGVKQMGKIVEMKKAEQVAIEFAPEKKTDQLMVDPRSIEVVVKNPRELALYGDLTSLKAQIKDKGVLNPVAVTKIKGAKGEPTRYRLVDGFRRMLCVDQLLDEGVDIKYVPIKKLKANMSEGEILLYQIAYNETKRFEAYEMAKIFEKLLGYGYDKKEIAARTGVTVRYVEKLTEVLTTAPKKVLNEVSKGKVGMNTVFTIQKSYPDRVEELVLRAIEALDKKTADKPAKGKVNKPAKPKKITGKDINKIVKEDEKKSNRGKGNSIKPQSTTSGEFASDEDDANFGLGRTRSNGHLEVSKNGKFSSEKQVERFEALVNHFDEVKMKEVTSFLNDIKRYMEGETNLNALIAKANFKGAAIK
jgi:ParB family chromosome partitioning protein